MLLLDADTYSNIGAMFSNLDAQVRSALVQPCSTICHLPYPVMEGGTSCNDRILCKIVPGRQKQMVPHRHAVRQLPAHALLDSTYALVVEGWLYLLRSIRQLLTTT